MYSADSDASYSLMKTSEPNVSADKPVGWNCACLSNGTDDCTVIASAVCVNDN